mgnify:CR=1 FL=1
MVFFSQKYPVLYLSKQSIDPGQVTVGKEVLYQGSDACTYTEETLVHALKEVQRLFQKDMRVILSEELVYVTELSFPSGTHLTRDLVQQTLKGTIPEDVSSTEWDFQTLHFAQKQEAMSEIRVQVAVVEGRFFRQFTKALETVALPIVSIVPESYVLAQMVQAYEGGTLLVARNRETTLLAAVENGFVIATRSVKKSVSPEDISAFLLFVASHKERTIARIIFSHFSSEEMAPFQALVADGYELLSEDLNPLVGAVLQVPLRGTDETILNLQTFLSKRKRAWWQIW